MTPFLIWLCIVAFAWGLVRGADERRDREE